MNDLELYAIVEINTRHIKFMVFNFLKSQANVLFTNIEQGKFCENGIILEPKVVGKIINAMVKKANSLLAIQIKRVALNLPSNYLTIRQSQAVIEANEDNHKIDNYDIKELIRMSKNISLSQGETICLTRPYKYIVDDTKKTPFAPLDQKAKKVSVNSLIYTVNSDVYDSHLEALKYSRQELLSLVLMPFSYGWGCSSRQELNDGIVIVDWNYDNAQISVFVKETLYDFNAIEYGFKHLVNDLQYVLSCSYVMANDYLQKIINIDNDFLENKIIYSKYDYQSEKYVEYSHQTLKNIIINRIEEVIIKIKEHLNNVLKSRNLPIVFIGEVTQISGFVNYVKKNSNLSNIRFYQSNIIGANHQMWAGLVGNAYYQHLLNKISIEKVFSIDRIIKEQQHSHLPNEKNIDYARKQ